MRVKCDNPEVIEEALRQNVPDVLNVYAGIEPHDLMTGAVRLLFIREGCLEDSAEWLQDLRNSVDGVMRNLGYTPCGGGEGRHGPTMSYYPPKKCR